jgi:hypothetical protein
MFRSIRKEDVLCLIGAYNRPEAKDPMRSDIVLRSTQILGVRT